MINKKRLAMMALATSMMLPNSLSIISPVLAEEPPVEPAPATGTDLLKNSIDGTTKVLAAGDYELDKDLTDLADTILITGKVTIDLKGKNISSTKTTFNVQENGELTITGEGTIASSSGNVVAVTGKGKVVIDGSENSDNSKLSLASTAASSYTLGFHQVTAKDSTLTVKNATLTSGGVGIYVNGNIDSETTKVDLTDVKIESGASGIYQAGQSTVTATNCNITSTDSCGIETRAGKLTVSGGTIAGNTEAPLEVEANGNGTTTLNAGIAIAQHTTDKPISVEIKDNAKIEGWAALAITDPQDKQAGVTDKDNDIEIKVEDATLDGTKYDVAYTEDTIKFDLDGTKVDKNKIQKLLTVPSTDENGNPIKELVIQNGELVPGVVDKENPAYTLTPAPSTPVYTGGGNKKPSKPKPEDPAEEPMEPVVATPTSMYRLYNKLTGEHLYTIDKNERDNLLTSDTWKDEGEGWIAPSVSDYPVYRLLNPNNGDHHYTTDKSEFDTLPSYGWVAEGVAFFSADKNNAENVLLHRVYNPNATGAGSHHYTADTNERDALVAQGWKYEGLAWAGLPANK